MTIDCMACLVSITRGNPTNSTYRDIDGITHAAYQHGSYGFFQALTCTFNRRGTLTLVPR